MRRQQSGNVERQRRLVDQRELVRRCFFNATVFTGGALFGSVLMLLITLLLGSAKTTNDVYRTNPPDGGVQYAVNDDAITVVDDEDAVNDDSIILIDVGDLPPAIDCNNDKVVMKDYFCSMNVDTTRQSCRRRRREKSRDGGNDSDYEQRHSSAAGDELLELFDFDDDDYAFSTFDPDVLDDGVVNRKLLRDLRIHLARVACMTKNILTVLSTV